MASRVTAQPWLINKYFDPIFAIGMGFCAAALRVRRESIERLPEQDNSYGMLWSKAVVRGRGYFGYDK